MKGKFMLLVHRLRVSYFMANQIHPHPIFFFVVLLLVRSQIIDISAFASYLFIFGVFLFISRGYNYAFYCAPLITVNMIVVPWIGLLLCLFWANKIWKLYIFAYLFGFSLVISNSNLLNIYQILFCTVILTKTYHTMIFQTVSDNKYFFSGFFMLNMLSTFQLISIHSPIDEQMSWENKLLLSPFLLFLGFFIINYRSQLILQSKQGRQGFSKDQNLLRHYTELITVKISTKYGLLEYLKQHCQNCDIVSCFCHRYYNKSNEKIIYESKQKQICLKKQIIKNIYQNFIGLQNTCIQSIRISSIQNYLQFLIEAQQFWDAFRIFYELKETSKNYLQILDDVKIRQKIHSKLKIKSYYDTRTKIFEKIFCFDYNNFYMIKQIREILFLKIQFWKEICKQTPYVLKLEQLGFDLIKKIEELNKFFFTKIRPTRQILQNSNCSVIYATYLLATTNYSDFASSLLKQNKIMINQDIGQLQNMNNSVYGLKLSLKINKQYQSIKRYDLFIQNISNSLCLLLNRKKNFLLNSSIKSIIPPYFVSLHSESFNQYINNAKIEESCFMNEQIQLPFAVNEHKVIFLKISCQFYLDILQDQIDIQCILKFPTQVYINLIMNMKGKVKYFDCQNHQDLIKKNNYQPLLKQIQQEYRSTKTISNRLGKIMVSDSLFSFYINGMFVKKSNLLKKQPLLRLKVEFQYLNTQNKVNRDNKEGIYDQKNQDVHKFELRDDISSQSSLQTNKDSIENILQTLLNTSVYKINKMYVVFTVIATLFILAGFLSLSYSNTSWSNKNLLQSPVMTISSYMLLREYYDSIISWELDKLIFDIVKDNHPEGELINNLGSDKDYLTLANMTMYQYFERSRKIYNQYVLGEQTPMKLQMKIHLQKQVNVRNPKTVHQNQILNIAEPEQTLSFESLLMNFIVDAFNLINGDKYESTLLSFKYISQSYQQFKFLLEDAFTDLKVQIESSENINIVIVSIVLPIFLLFFIPLYKISEIRKNKRKTVYMVLTSLDSKLVAHEIDNLIKFEEEVEKLHHKLQKVQNQKNNLQNQMVLISSQNQCPLQQQNKQEEQKNQLLHQQKQLNFSNLIQGLTNLASQQIAVRLRQQKRGEAVQMRKRAGDLNLSGSSCDKKKFLFIDWYSFIFFFLFILINMTQFTLKRQVQNITINELEKSKSLFDSGENITFSLLNSKNYFAFYNYSNRYIVQGHDLKQWLNEKIESFEITLDQDTVKKSSCNQSLQICKQIYSQALLKYLILNSIQNSYNLKTKILDNQTFSIEQKSKTTFEIFYSQQLDDVLIKERVQTLQQYIQKLVEEETAILNYLRFIQIIFWGVLVVYIGVLFVVIFKKKKKFLQEVTFLSFLNKTMLHGNKRVESYVKKLIQTYR